MFVCICMHTTGRVPTYMNSCRHMSVCVCVCVSVCVCNWGVGGLVGGGGVGVFGPFLNIAALLWLPGL